MSGSHSTVSRASAAKPGQGVGEGPAPVLVVAGPTASGKSGLALAVARAFGGVIINADSMQVYRDLRILTARPDRAAERAAPHRLYGVLPAAEICSASRWRDMALAEIREATAVGKLAILVGGTGLYLRALARGIAAVPDIPDEIRREGRALHAKLGGGGFRADLAARDPVMAARLHDGDSQRLIRAWEVATATGRSLADWQESTTGGPPAGLKFHEIVLQPPREALYAACNERFEAMVAAGAIEEVAGLLAQGLAADLPVMKALGVREIAGHLAGDIDRATAIRLAQQSTRRYAKRQTTWFRHQMSAAWVIDAQYSESLRSKIFSFIRRFVLTGRA